ncbi:hypothetical protein [Haematobacter sp. UBA3484]|uniref:hypothetical protein n=1 Tax=Haematobacter sp. UBA3484 TaxID=1946582 RepID=UPI0025BAF66D|nr:hypothetical protein [Haematobacter sp. UBA3484]
MPLYRYWPRAAGLVASKLTTSTALASLMASTGYAVRTLSVTSGEYTTASGSTEQPFTATSSSGDVSISGVMPPGAQLIYTDDPQRQAVILLAGGGTVEITGRTPATTTSIDPNGRTMHGSTVNLGVQSISTGFPPDHGYDARSRPPLTGPNQTFNLAKVATFPLTLSAGDVLNCALSETTLWTADNGTYVTEYFSLTVMNGSAPAGDVFAPQVCRASGVAPVLTGVDIDAIYATLPSYDASGSVPPADLDIYLEKAEKFQGSLRGNYMALDGTNYGGFADFIPHNSGWGGGTYGRRMSTVMAAIYPLLWTDAGTEAQRKRALRAVISQGLQYDGMKPGPNGGIWTWEFPMTYLARHFTGKSLSQYVIGGKGVTPQEGGNTLGQFYVETAENLLRYRTPHTNNAEPTSCAIRSVESVTGMTVTMANPTGYSRLGKWSAKGLLLKTVDGMKSVMMTAPSANETSSSSVTVTLQGATNPFVAGDQVYFCEDGTLQPGDPGWAIRWRDTGATQTRADSAAEGAGYRIQSVGGDFALLAQALGIVQPSWVNSLVAYMVNTAPPVGQARGSWPTALNNYPHIFESETYSGDNPVDTWGLRLFRAHWSALSAVPQIGA